MEIPSAKDQRHFYEFESVIEIASFVATLLGLLVQVGIWLYDKLSQTELQRFAAAMASGKPADLKRFSEIHPTVPWVWVSGWLLALGGLLSLFWVRFQRARRIDLEVRQAKGPDGLRGCAHVLYSMLSYSLGVDAEDGRLRITVFRVTPTDGSETPELEQVIDYIGTEDRYGAGRRFPLSAGIVGLVARSGEPKVAGRTKETDDEYRAELVEHWGFTRQMAANIRMDRKSYLAVPINDNDGQTLGLVYADSSIEDAFKDVTDLFGEAVVGFAAYLEERF